MLITTSNRPLLEIAFSCTSLYASLGRRGMFVELRGLRFPRVNFEKDSSAVYVTLGWLEFTFDRKSA